MKSGGKRAEDDVGELGFGSLEVENNVDGIRSACTVVRNK